MKREWKMSHDAARRIVRHGVLVQWAGPIYLRGNKAYRAAHVKFPSSTGTRKITVCLGNWVSHAAAKAMSQREEHVCDDECRSNGCTQRHAPRRGRQLTARPKRGR